MAFPEHEFAALLGSAIKQEIEKVISGEIQQAQERVEHAVRGAVGSIAAHVLEKFSYERVGRDLVIRVQFAFPETKL